MSSTGYSSQIIQTSRIQFHFSELPKETAFCLDMQVSIKVFIAAISEPRSFNGTEAEPLVIKIG